ncbi:pentatricopeptide repeat-containing protein At4g19191, mitochondrial-like [Primulina huaijiensis]|uniref:pentatricopeptide repeat-containing protein At4g19191, mitochondrial-like n=1 Tax=Primulina huaijiensis TaxID=1492673 RepID=UPI003CC776E5
MEISSSALATITGRPREEAPNWSLISSSRLRKNLLLLKIFNIPSLRFNGFNPFYHLRNHFLSSNHAHKSFSLLSKSHHLKIHKFYDFAHPFSSSAVAALNSCRSLQCLRQIHASVVVSNGHELLSAVASKLISLYTQFNDFGSSVSLIKSLREAGSFLWNSLMQDYVNSGFVESAFLVFKLMRSMDVPCDGFTFPILIKIVVSLDESSARFPEMIHCVGMRMGFESDVYFCNTMIDAHVKSGCFMKALKLFDEMRYKDLVSWTSVISGYACEGNVVGAVALFNEMRKEVEPNVVTMIVMMQTCSNVVLGSQFHGYVVKSGFLLDRSLKNSILKMYADFGCLDDSEILFKEIVKRDVVSWNIMISLYSSRGETLRMTDCFATMRGEVEPSIETLTTLISGLAEFGNHYAGRQLHCLAYKYGFLDHILSSSLLDLYAKSADFETLSQLFRDVSHRNSNTWGTMISILTENGYFDEAVDLFRQMVVAGIQPMTENLRSLVAACMHLGTLRLGKVVHGYCARNYHLDCNEDSLPLETSILNMYVKCGNISSARIFFDRTRVKDLVTWSSMIEGCGMHGLGHESLELFRKMKNEGIEPNRVTFLSLLSACSHSGLLLESCEILISMNGANSIEPDLDHYTCLVDLLGRSGKTKEALSIILKLHILPDSRIWAALLAAARVHEDQKVSEYASEKLFELENQNVGYYTLLCNARARVGKWDDVEEVRNGLKDKNLMKHPGWSYLQVEETFHGFVSGDRCHSQSDEIYRVIECLYKNVIEA